MSPLSLPRRLDMTPSPDCLGEIGMNSCMSFEGVRLLLCVCRRSFELILPMPYCNRATHLSYHKSLLRVDKSGRNIYSFSLGGRV